MRIILLIGMCFLFGCNDIKYNVFNEYKIVILATNTMMQYNDKKKYYYPPEGRKQRKIIYPINCQLGIFYIPKNSTPDFIAVQNVIQELQNYKINSNDKYYQYFKEYALSKEVIGMIDVIIERRRQVWFLLITQECLQVSGIPITKQQLEELEKQGAIYDEI